MAFCYFLALIILRSISVFSKPPEMASSSSILSHDKQIDHTQFMVDGISKQYLDEKSSDVVFVVNNEKLHAHRYIIASHSEYFSKYFDNGFEESGQPKIEIEVVTSSPTAFKRLLNYSYTGRINLGDLESKDIVELFRLSNYFGFLNLLLSLSEYFRRNFTIHSACSLFAEARLYGDGKLYADLLDFIETNTLSVLQSEDFLSLPQGALQDILNRDTFFADELDIFEAVCRWIRTHQDLDSDTKNQVLSVVRYPLIGDHELLTVVSRSQFINEEPILDIINSKKKSPPKELECLRRVSKATQEPNVNFLNTSQVNADINETDAVTIINLGQPKTINYIDFTLPVSHLWVHKTKKEWYSYYIEVSINGFRWMRVLDYSDYICRSFQRLWIDPQTVQYIKIVGTRNALNRKFEILNIMNNTKKRPLVDIRNGLVVPKYNVALNSMSATVIEESDFSQDAMLTGEIQKIFRTCTCHRWNTGCIVVQLAQPYMLSSMRMYLLNKNYADIIFYTVEVSVDYLVWEKIVDGINKLSKLCPTILFEPRAVVFIRITGVYNLKGKEKIYTDVTIAGA